MTITGVGSTNPSNIPPIPSWQSDLVDANIALNEKPPNIALATQCLERAGRSIPPPPNDLVHQALTDLAETPPDVAAVKALIKPYIP